jgi:hypothetical protein
MGKKEKGRFLFISSLRALEDSLPAAKGGTPPQAAARNRPDKVFLKFFETF